jgi:hypothetical protein
MATVAAVCVRAVRRVYYSRPSAVIWGLGEDDGEYNLVLPARFISEDVTKAPGWPWVPSGDAYAAALVVQTLRRLKKTVRVEIHAAGELPAEKRVRENLVCIGGPTFNEVTADLMTALDVPLTYDDELSPGHPAMRSKSGAYFVSEVEVDQQGWRVVKEDWGAVVVAQSPYLEASRSGKRVFLIMGNGSQGTFGAAKVLSVPDHQDVGSALMELMPFVRSAHSRRSPVLYSREICASLSAREKCAFLFRSRVEGGYVEYPYRGEEVQWY